MSAIGDYIHYSASNYTFRGINRRDAEEANWNYISAKKKYKSTAINPSLEAKAEELSNILNNIFSKAVKKNQGSNTIYDKAFKLLEERLNTQWENKNTLIGSLTASGNVSLTDKQKQLLATLTKIEKLSDKTQKTYQETIRKRLAACIQNINKRANDGLISTTEAVEIKKNVKIVWDAVRAAAKTSTLIDIKNLSLDPTNPSAPSIFNAINDIIEASNYTSTLNAQKGDIFEYAIALAMMILDQQAEKAIDESIMNSLDQLSAKLNFPLAQGFGLTLAGATTQNIEINLKNFDANIGALLKKNGFKNYQLDSAGTLFTSVLASQNKVDIVADLKHYNANISAKNYNFEFAKKTGRGIRVLEGASMLTLLQNENADLINHYLNIAAVRPKQKHLLEIRKGVFVKTIKEEIKAVVLYKALSGNQQGSLNKADYFIVNDNTRTGVDSIKVYSINQIFNKAMSNLDKITFTINNKIPLDAMQLKNIHVKANGGSYAAAETRIANILQDLHTKKLSIALSPDLLT